MHWGGVIGGVLISVFVMLAVWRLLRKLEGKKSGQTGNSQPPKNR